MGAVSALRVDPGESNDHVLGEKGAELMTCATGEGCGESHAAGKCPWVLVERLQPAPDAAMRDMPRGKGGIKFCSVVIAGVPCGLLEGHLFSGGHGVRLGEGFTPVKLARPSCGTCTHVHVGPCSGTSPNGEFACPCGHPKVAAKRGRVNIVGTYDGNRSRESANGALTAMGDALHGATATLYDNLDRERPPGRRPIRTVTRYEGNSDD